eukprot:307459-Pelagomonas_calceolata.AAC.1
MLEAFPDFTPVLRTSSLRNPNRTTKMTLRTILLGVAGNIYNDYTITPLVELGLTRHKTEKLASQSSCHALQSLTKNLNTRHTSYLQGSSSRGVTGGEAAQSRRRESTPAGAWLTATSLTLISCSPAVHSLVYAGPVNLLGEALAS